MAAINLPHGDQTACKTCPVDPTLAVHESHEVGFPVTAFGLEEQICWPYSFQTIDEWGARKSAEW